MYEPFYEKLHEKLTSPPGAPNITKYRLVDTYTRCTEVAIKENIVSAFVKPDSNLRVVITTTAFGMGLDCPSVHQIIHWGPANDIDDYVQQTGRGGHDGQLSAATLLFTSADQQYTSKAMMMYSNNNSVCRPRELFQYSEDQDLQ